MPIRFRCAYCNQLMGIARRKAGTVVRCPTCAGQVVVPSPGVEESQKAPAGDGNPFLFEHGDFDDLLNPARSETAAANPGELVPPAPPGPPAAAPRVSTDPASAMAGTHIEAGFDVEPLASPQPASPVDRPGKTGPRARMLMLVALAIVALALAFGAGIVVGHWLWPAPREEGASYSGPAVIQIVPGQCRWMIHPEDGRGLQPTGRPSTTN